MSSKEIGLIEKYASLIAVFPASGVDDFLKNIGQRSAKEMSSNYFDSPNGGKGFLFTDVHLNGINYVAEVLPNPVIGDALTTFYMPHPAFNGRDELIVARRELIEVIEDMKQAQPGALRIQCPQRKRPVALKECGTRQLYDLMVSLVNKLQGR